MKIPFRTSLVLLSLSFAAHAAPAYPEYRVTIVGPANSSATDINEAGVVVGTYPAGAPLTRGFINRGKGVITLGTLGGTSSNAVAINDKGQVLGNWTTQGGQQRGYIDYQGRQRDIGTIPGLGTTYTDINNAGYITAIGFTPGGGFDGTRSFLRSPNGKFRDIGKLPFEEPTLTNAFALNNRNQITGESGPFTFPEQPVRAFVWTNGVMRDLGDFGLEPNSGRAINDRGQITGYMSLPEGDFDQVAFLYSNGRLLDIDGRPPTEDRYSQGNGINNYGHIVGFSNHLSGFIWRGRKMQSLNALIDPRLGWNITDALAINDAGQIAANATRGGVQYAVRLDLIRPHLLAAPDLGAEAAVEAAVSPAQAAAEAKAEEEAQRREVVKPVQQ